MPQYNSQDDDLSSNSHFLSPPLPSLRKSPSRHQHLNTRKSSASLRAPASLALDDDVPAGGGTSGRHHSLAHELAVALMPEPSTGSKLLAEEFGIEYDEGAEGIDPVPSHSDLNGNDFANPEVDAASSLASELGGASMSDASHDSTTSTDTDERYEFHNPGFSSPTLSRKKAQNNKPDQDAMEVLAIDLESTDKFLNHLRTIDVDSSVTQQISLEKIASDVIRHINESVRDREGQVRELLECEREFRKISGEVGGNDVLGMLDELTGVDELLDKVPTQQDTKVENKRLDTVVEEEPGSPNARQMSHDWELDPDRPHLGDEDYDFPEVASPTKESFPPPPPLIGPLTPGSTVPHLSYLRTSTTSLVSNLTTLSEHAQVNGAATAEAGRKIRALKNKLGSWRTEWDSAERSRQRIERWEAEIGEGDLNSPSRTTSRRVDGRITVQEHLYAFELALADAATKTQAIMAIMAR